MFIFFFNDTATTEIYTLSLHDALPILASEVEGQVLFDTAKVGYLFEIRIGLLIAQNREEFATTIGLVVVFGDDTFGNIQKQDIRLHIRLLPLGHNPLLVIQRNDMFGGKIGYVYVCQTR